MTLPDVQNIVLRFFNSGEISKVEPLAKGLINDTFYLESEVSGDDYILQKINKEVFKEPEKVMHNLILIHNTLKKEKDSSYQLPDLLPNRTGDLYVIDENNDYWRVFTYIQNSRTIEHVEDPAQAYEAAKAFGNFLKNLTTLDASLLDETIYRFHDYQYRFEMFEDAIKMNKFNRKDECTEEIDQIYRRLGYIRSFLSIDLPIRVVHGDTKIHNVLFSQNSDRAIAVIDLDISMPASVLYDYGEMVRSYTNTVNEDDPNINEVKVDLEIFKELTRGFLSELSDILTKTEIKNIMLGPKLIIYIQCIRFLTDYLLGDIYYKTNYISHNLVRSRNQLALLKQIEDNERKLQDIIDRQFKI